MDTALLYVSRRLVPYPDVRGAIVDIIAVSRVRNAALDITGALIATPAAFAQLLEGPKTAVDALMASIRKDRRHDGVRVLSEAPTKEHRFTRLSIAYWGASTYVAGHVEPLAEVEGAGPPDAGRVQRLLRLMDAFSKGEQARAFIPCQSG